MPANTTRGGLPYPLGTDRVMDGDDAIKALAERLDGSTGAIASVPYAIAQGSVVHSFSSGTQSTAAVTFPVGRFSIAPSVQQSQQGAGLANTYAPRMTGGNTTSGFTSVCNTSAAATGSVTVTWTAVQMTSTTAGG